MNRVVLILFLLILLSSCQKNQNDLIWEKSLGKGAAYYIKSSPDSGFVACGSDEGKPYFIRYNKKSRKLFDFKPENQGLFSSVWYDTSGYIAGGSTNGNILLMRYSKSGRKIWEQSIDAGFKIDFTKLFYSGSDKLLAIGTPSSDSTNSGPLGFMFVRFDTTGQIITEKKITDAFFISATGAVVDNEGNIFLALTRCQSQGDKSRASVAKYNEQFQKLWETELYNNPNFGAAAETIISDESDNIYLAGKTELMTQKGTLNNSFVSSLTSAGEVRWKQYREGSNEGRAMVFNSIGELIMLNMNCFILDLLNPDDGIDAGTIRTYSECNSTNTDAIGSSIDLNFDGNILISGSKGGYFYLALKASK
jgi:hypothetical protein